MDSTFRSYFTADVQPTENISAEEQTYSTYYDFQSKRDNQSPETKEDKIRNIVVDAYMNKPPQYEEERASRKNSVENSGIIITEEVLHHEGDIETTIPPQLVSPLINTRALKKNAETYELENFEKKALVIFNQFEINGYQPRYGTDEDVKVLTNTFEKLGFEVTEHKNYTRDQILQELKSFTSRNFVEYGCIAIAVLTHGSSHGLLMAKDYDYSEQVIIEHLKVHNKPTLITKPKMVIIQACRGKKSLKGVDVHRHMGRIHLDSVEEEVDHYTLPIEADMVVVHSTFVGKPANRCLVTGSWFIQTLCEKIDLLAGEMDFESIFREVNRTIAIEKSDSVYNRSTQEMDINKQMPMISSSLIRKLYLRNYKGATESFSDRAIAEPSTPLTPAALISTEDVSSASPRNAFGTRVTVQYFDYLKDCLRIFIEDNPDDKTAQNLLMVAETFGNGKKFNEPRKKMCRAVCEHLRSNADKIPFYKYLFICESFAL